MNESEIPKNELTIEEMTASPPGWLNIPNAEIKFILEGTAVLGVVIVMIYGMNRVFRRLKDLGEGFGPNALKSLGIVLFLPSLVLLALLTDFKTETLAALLGTVAGYVLSNTEEKSKQLPGTTKPGAQKPNETDNK
jgi:hypothetical protein